MKTTKKVGRPKKFDREQALTTAVNVFWRKGYDGASLSDLTKAIGINPPSLYAEFGDKEKLYRLAIEHYASNDACKPLVMFEDQIHIKDAVGAFLNEVILYSTRHESGAKGCFLSSCVATTAGEVEGVQSLMKQAIETTEKRLIARFDKAKSEGELGADFPSKQQARLMFDLRQGLVFRARAGCSAASMKKDLVKWIDIILDA